MSDHTRTPGVEEMLLTPEQRERLHADLMEIARQRHAASDAVRYWPAPFDRVHVKDARPE